MKSSPNFNIVLVEPLIPQNTGNIGRLCVGTNSKLHLIEPLGFDISDKAARRAGLDYWQHLDMQIHPSFIAFKESLPADARLWFISKFGKKDHFSVEYQNNDYLIFGKETKGLADSIHEQEDPESFLQIPMFSDNIRCLNLANSASIVLYEAIRQTSI